MYPVPPAEFTHHTPRLIIPVMHIILWLRTPLLALEGGPWDPWGRCDRAIERARDQCAVLDHCDGEHGPPVCGGNPFEGHGSWQTQGQRAVKRLSALLTGRCGSVGMFHQSSWAPKVIGSAIFAGPNEVRVEPVSKRTRAEH